MKRLSIRVGATNTGEMQVSMEECTSGAYVNWRDAENELAALRSENAALKTEIDTIRAERDKWEELYEEAAIERDALQAENAALKVEAAELLHDKQATIDDITARLAEAEKDRDAARSQVDELADKCVQEQKRAEKMHQWYTDQLDRAKTSESRLRDAEMEKSATYEYRVSVQEMVESHRTTYWVCLDRPDRPKDAKPWDKGRITPFMTGIKEHAEIEAKRWSEFLSLSPPVPLPWVR